ncbi:LOW QUALITY PROTEIN: hypothetical protein PHMEG_00031104 [Phytophthora megakarya]|uniref:Uncharacterized protein n=1 Tax=Phytophthora megakarya TaxID=4795 RepID=A0A225V155_9STRA|nr:LOW QUALITY PROTEIN: hypothetical protein PHMEG_00031104 [Phytophthora megakarya]
MDLKEIEAGRQNLGAPSDRDQFIEASFATHFGHNIRKPGFWEAFDQACSFAADGLPWHMPRQLMLSHSLPQQGETMMTLAAMFGRAKVVSILCQIKGDPRIETAKVSTIREIILKSAAYNHINIFEALLNLSVSMNETDSRLGYTPLHLAASVDNVEVLKIHYDSKQADFWKKAKNER